MKVLGSKGVGMKKDILLCTSLEVEEPISYQEVIYSPKSGRVDGCHKRWDGLNGKKKFLELVDPPSRCKSIKNTLVFKIKHQVDSLIDKFRPDYS